jgi:hypothetical protein
MTSKRIAHREGKAEDPHPARPVRSHGRLTCKVCGDVVYRIGRGPNAGFRHLGWRNTAGLDQWQRDNRGR